MTSKTCMIMVVAMVAAESWQQDEVNRSSGGETTVMTATAMATSSK